MPGPFASARFVGREEEFGRLASVIEDAASGRPATLLVGADIGLGGSRFIDEATDRLARLTSPVTVLRCRAADARHGRAYEPIVHGIRPLLAELSDEELADVVGPAGDVVARLLPDLASRLDGLDLLPAMPVVIEPERHQPRLLEAVHGILDRLAARRPVVVILEDLHRMDAGSRSVAAFLTRVSRAQRVAVVATYQPDALARGHPFHETLGAMTGGPRPPVVLALPPLDRYALAELIAGVEGERPTASTLLLVTERSAGSPLVAEELLAARRELSSSSLTGSFETLVTARLALRTAECRRALRLIAPATVPLTRTDLAAAAAAFEEGILRPPPRTTTAPRRGDGVLDPDLSAGVAEALEHGFLVEQPAADGPTADGPTADGAPATVLALRHELLGPAILADLLPRHRPRHHAALAVALAERPAVALGHWLGAHQPAAAREAAIAAADDAESLDAPDVAFAALDRALELTEAAREQTGAFARASERAAAGLEGDAPAIGARAAELALAAGHPGRAVAFAEAAAATLDERRDRVALGRLLERLGQYRRAAGDHEGARAAIERSVGLLGTEGGADHARALAALAQLRMLDGTFSDAIRLATRAIDGARAAGDAGRVVEVSALTTLGVSEGWGDDPTAAVDHLRESLALAKRLGRLDEVFRAYANLTTILDLDGHREEAVEVATEGIDVARTVGLEAVYGNFLRGNAADSLFYLGRWAEARALTRISLEWSPAGIGFVNSAINLAIVEVESEAGETAGRLLGRLLLELETVRDSQYAVPVYGAAASFALWRDDLADARRAAELGWARVRDTEDWVLVARSAATVLEVAAVAATGAGRRDLGVVASARQTGSAVLAAAESAVRASGVGRDRGSRREADARLATARAYAGRMGGRDDPAAWAAVATEWDAVGDRYQAAKARWREAEAVLGAAEARAGRAQARAPLEAAAGAALDLGARPLLRRLDELAARARIRLPDALADRVTRTLAIRPSTAAGRDGAGRGPVAIPIRPGLDAGWSVGEPVAAAGVVGAAIAVPVGSSAAAGVAVPAPGGVARELVGAVEPRRADTFGLSPREREVLGLIAEGRTNREIGERLFISQKTVGVHVGNILGKLGVSGRVEAAAVAIRLGLTPGD
jgi:DNA-binding CsgD family transcriptional regulator/tetratricopeptide (TPR) repeat protein